MARVVIVIIALLLLIGAFLPPTDAQKQDRAKDSAPSTCQADPACAAAYKELTR